MKSAKLVAAAAASLLLVACSHSPPTTFLALNAVAPVQSETAGLTPPAPPFRVDAAHIPAIFDRPEVVTQATANALDVHDFTHWAAPLGELVRTTLTQDLAARMPAGSVLFPDTPKPLGAGSLVVDILSLGRSGNEMVMDVSWTLTGRGADENTAIRRTLQLHTPAQDHGAASQASILSRLLGQLADELARDSVVEPMAGAN